MSCSEYNIAKANVIDREVQNLVSYINVNSLGAIHKTMDKNKADGMKNNKRKIWTKSGRKPRESRRKENS